MFQMKKSKADQKEIISAVPLLDKFFVYGTLKVGGHFSTRFDRLRKSDEKAIIIGFDLYDLGSFPAITKGDGEVVGELHKYSDPKEALAHMDMIEGYNGDPDHDLYKRIIIPVTIKGGEQIDAWVYVFNNKIPNHAKKIVNGCWEI